MSQIIAVIVGSLRRRRSPQHRVCCLSRPSTTVRSPASSRTSLTTPHVRTGRVRFTGKPADVIGISVGAIGAAAAQQHLRDILAYLDIPTLGQPEAFIQAKEGFFESDGSIAAASKQLLQQRVDRYVARRRNTRFRENRTVRMDQRDLVTARHRVSWARPPAIR